MGSEGADSAILMDVKTWTNKIVGQISESMCLDCADDVARLRNEDVLVEERINPRCSRKSWSGRTTWAYPRCSVPS